MTRGLSTSAPSSARRYKWLFCVLIEEKLTEMYAKGSSYFVLAHVLVNLTDSDFDLHDYNMSTGIL